MAWIVYHYLFVSLSHNVTTAVSHSSKGFIYHEHNLYAPITRFSCFVFPKRFRYFPFILFFFFFLFFFMLTLFSFDQRLNTLSSLMPKLILLFDWDDSDPEKRLFAQFPFLAILLYLIFSAFQLKMLTSAAFFMRSNNFSFQISSAQTCL